MRKCVIVVLAIALLATGILLLRSSPVEEPGPDLAPEVPASIPDVVRDDGYVSSESCRECHVEQYDSWHRSYHRTMTQRAGPETVVAPFDNVELESRNRRYLLEREGDEFRVTMADPDWEVGALASGVDLDTAAPPAIRRPIVMTTGSHHMQGYWINCPPGNQLRQIPWYYLIADQRWVPREDVFLEPPGGRHFMVWNDNCITCHAVAGQPRMDYAELTIATVVAEFGIACEACHGPGEQHVALRRRQAEDPSVDPRSDTIINPQTTGHQISAQICGQCHSAFSPGDLAEFQDVGYQFRAGEELVENRLMWTFEEVSKERYSDRERGFYWDDGTCRVGGREYMGLAASPCYEQGELSCLSCHSMHAYADRNDQLADRMDGNHACVQCHSEFDSRIEAHTHHPADSSGSLCYNCHMPHTSYALLKAIRSHQISSPRVQPIRETHLPNACNLCHQNQTLQWTADHLTDWYGSPSPVLDAEEATTSAAVLWLLSGSTMQRMIVACSMGWPPALRASGDGWQPRFLAHLLRDRHATLRYVAGRSLRQHPGFDQWEFDFIGSPVHLAASQQDAIEIWRSHVPTVPADEAEALLMSPQTGELDEARLERLWKLRDRSPEWLPE